MVRLRWPWTILEKMDRRKIEKIVSPFQILPTTYIFNKTNTEFIALLDRRQHSTTTIEYQGNNNNRCQEI
jgi:hypothetical protein